MDEVKIAATWREIQGYWMFVTTAGKQLGSAIPLDRMNSDEKDYEATCDGLRKIFTGLPSAKAWVHEQLGAQPDRVRELEKQANYVHVEDPNYTPPESVITTFCGRCQKVEAELASLKNGLDAAYFKGVEDGKAFELAHTDIETILDRIENIKRSDKVKAKSWEENFNYYLTKAKKELEEK